MESAEASNDATSFHSSATVAVQRPQVKRVWSKPHLKSGLCLLGQGTIKVRQSMEGRVSNIFVRWDIFQMQSKVSSSRHFFYLFRRESSYNLHFPRLLGESCSVHTSFLAFVIEGKRSSKRYIKPWPQGHWYHLQGWSKNLVFAGLDHVLPRLLPRPSGRRFWTWWQRDDVPTAKVSGQSSCLGKSIPEVPITKVSELEQKSSNSWQQEW